MTISGFDLTFTNRTKRRLVKSVNHQEKDEHEEEQIIRFWRQSEADLSIVFVAALQNPSSTILPRAVPLSICACTRRKVAASILPAVSVAVERMRPASTSAATSVSICPWRAMSGVPNIERVNISSRAQAPLIDDGNVLANTFGPEYRMLLIGAGQLTEYLATMAVFSGFAVTVCDPREEYRASWSVPGVTLLTGMPDDVVHDYKVDRRSCVIALTHDPKLDDLALLEALDTEAFYVGAIGSRRNNEARHARMIEHLEQTAERLARLRGPIGIYIGSKTPPEIAVSIMAEVLAVKNGVPLPRDMDVTHAKNTLADGASMQPGSTCLSLSDSR